MSRKYPVGLDSLENQALFPPCSVQPMATRQPRETGEGRGGSFLILVNTGVLESTLGQCEGL